MRRVLGLLILMAATKAHAGEYVAARRIVDMGCHNSATPVCYVTLDGAVFGSSLSCLAGATNQFRFDNGDTRAGALAYSTLLTAFVSGRRVSVFLEGCTSQGNPKLDYYHILE